MKKYLIFLLIAGVFPQAYGNEFAVKSFEKIDNDLSARRYERKDVNDIPCAIIKIRTDIPKPFVFDANLGIEGDVLYKESNEIWIYVSEGERQLTIAKDGFITLKYALPRIEKSLVYSLVLTAKENKVSVVIISDPPDAEKWIDGKSLGNGNRFNIEIGQHNLEIRSSGYTTFKKTITVNDKNAIFQNIRLVEQEKVKLTLKSKPEGATIYLDGVDVGQTNKQLFKFPGEYSLRLSKSKYETIEQRIEVSESGDNTWDFNLLKLTAMLTIRTTPADAQIYIDRELKSSKSQELAPGRYRIEVKQDGWKPATETIVMVKGVDQTQIFTLTQKTGKLQLTVEPMEAKVILMQSGKQIDSWAGSENKKGIPVGDYSLKLSAAGYGDETRIITIRESKINTLEINLSPGTVTDIDGNVYKTVKIGDQIWMSENLKVTHYRNGDRIATGHSDRKWKKLRIGGYADYDNKQSNVEIYGRLYNWYAVEDSRNIAPEGWHVPAEAEWKELEMALGMSQDEAYGLYRRGTNEGSKLAGNVGPWGDSSLINGSEFGTSGFNALPGGCRNYPSGNYSNMGYYGCFWSATKTDSNTAWHRSLRCGLSNIYRSNVHRRSGFSVRLVLD